MRYRRRSAIPKRIHCVVGQHRGSTQAAGNVTRTHRRLGVAMALGIDAHP